MIFPNAITKDFIFRTDLKSLLRGLNSILGIGNMAQSRLRTLRVDQDGQLFTASTQFDLIKFAFLIVDENIKEETLKEENRGIFYDDEKDSYKFITDLSGDTKEALFIKEQVSGVTYLQSMVRNDVLHEESIHLYQNLLSAILDAYQINNGLLFLLHLNEQTFIINRGLTPDPNTEYTRFYFYSRIYEIASDNKLHQANFVQVHRHNLEIIGFEQSSDCDLAQMVLPVVHLYPFVGK